MSKTSILAETLANIQEIREGIEKNANHILRSTLKEDMEAIIKNGLKEVDDDEDLDTNDMGDDESPDFGAMGDSADVPGGEEPEMDMDTDMDMEMGGEEPGEPEVVDLTGEDDETVLLNYELLGPADEVEVVKSPEGGVQINIKPSAGKGPVGMEEPEMDMDTDMDMEMGGEEPEMDMDTDMDMEMGGEESEEEDEDALKEEELVYEIEIDEEEMEEGDAETMEERKIMFHRRKAKELHESLISTRKKLQNVVSENKNKTKELNKFKTLVNEFKTSEGEYKSAIKNLKNQLQEVALFTSNLTYAVKLMTENSTTKDEKLDILKRFDKAKTLTESREIFNSMNSLLNETKSSTKKSVNERVIQAPKTSGAKELNESTAYKNPQLDRMLDIINKIK